MDVFARVVVGVDGTEWGLGALRQALTLAPIDASTIDAVTALDTTPAVWTGFDDPVHKLGGDGDGAHAALPLWMRAVRAAEGTRPAVPVSSRKRSMSGLLDEEAIASGR